MPYSRERQIAANLQRQTIPRSLLIEFDQWTNEALGSFSTDGIVNPESRTFAGWELEYREAHGIFVDYDPQTWTLRRRELLRDEDFERAAAQDAKIPKIDRSRYGLEATRRRVLVEMRATPIRKCSDCGAEFHAAGPGVCTRCLEVRAGVRR